MRLIIFSNPFDALFTFLVCVNTVVQYFIRFPHLGRGTGRSQFVELSRSSYEGHLAFQKHVNFIRNGFECRKALVEIYIPSLFYYNLIFHIFV